MEKTSLPYSTKNIPVPSKNIYIQTLIGKGAKTFNTLRWKANFYLHPETRPKSKKKFNFKSTNPAPPINQLKEFEDKFMRLVRNIKFGKQSNHFQEKLREDVKKIKKESRAHIKGDKSNNYYKMESKDYKKLVDKEIQKEYRKATTSEVKDIETSHKNIVKELELEDRVFETTKSQCFATLKDHKSNFDNNPTVRLINPCKPEIGKIAKELLENINNSVRTQTKLKQWRNTPDVIQWFRSLQNKQNLKFIKFDVVNFYPNITENLLTNSINWARQFVDISKQDETIILQAKKSLLFNDNTPWIKNRNSDFDVAQGSYDGAETCELVGLFILADLSELDRMNAGLYRDDGLSVTPVPPRQAETLKKKIGAIFAKHGLSITAQANITRTDFLDVFFDLEADTYKSYNKPNNIPQYVHRLSNHPPLNLEKYT